MDHVLLITGSMGSGKTTTLGEASDLLTARGIVHAALDFDMLAQAHVRHQDGGSVALANLQSVCTNFEAVGVRRLLIAAAIESASELERLRTTTAAGDMVISRLRASPGTMEARVAARERGVFSSRYIRRVRELERILDAAALESFTVETTERSVTDVAHELLRRAGWIGLSS